MADSRYSLGILFEADSTKKDLEDDFGTVVLEGTGRPEEKDVANVSTQEWYGENGEEVFIPKSGVVFKPYDWKVKMGIKWTDADSVKSKFDALCNGLCGKVMTLTYNYAKVAVRGAWVKSIGQSDFSAVDGEVYMVFDVTFRVSRP